MTSSDHSFTLGALHLAGTRGPKPMIALNNLMKRMQFKYTECLFETDLFICLLGSLGDTKPQK